MSLRVSILGTGSKGNAIMLTGDRGALLVDAGFSRRELYARARRCGADPTSIQAIVCSHCHQDHVSGTQVLARHLRVPVYATAGTEAGTKIEQRPIGGFAHLRAGNGTVEAAGFNIRPFATSHDALEPVAFRIEGHGRVVVVCLDLGCITEEVREHLAGADLLVLESNHDLDLLKQGPYPFALKQRVASRTGHLSNTAACEYLRDVWDGHGQVVLAHLSQANNLPMLAQMAAEEALAQKGVDPERLWISTQDEPLEVVL